jgi:hypothetical protein
MHPYLDNSRLNRDTHGNCKGVDFDSGGFKARARQLLGKLQRAKIGHADLTIEIERPNLLDDGPKHFRPIKATAREDR